LFEVTDRLKMTNYPTTPADELPYGLALKWRHDALYLNANRQIIDGDTRLSYIRDISKGSTKFAKRSTAGAEPDTRNGRPIFNFTSTPSDAIGYDAPQVLRNLHGAQGLTFWFVGIPDASAGTASTTFSITNPQTSNQYQVVLAKGSATSVRLNAWGNGMSGGGDSGEAVVGSLTGVWCVRGTINAMTGDLFLRNLVTGADGSSGAFSETGPFSFPEDTIGVTRAATIGGRNVTTSAAASRFVGWFDTFKIRPEAMGAGAARDAIDAEMLAIRAALT
jgi:hypothetical protein